MNTLDEQRIRFEHLMRLDRPEFVPMKPTGRRVKKQPRTAIITAAAERAIREKKSFGV